MSHFRHCGRIAIYSKSQITGVNHIIKKADNNRNRNDELRALASFIVQINMANHNKNIISAVQNRKELSRIVLKNHSADVNGFQITSVISQLHSKISMAVCANCPVSMILQKI